MPRCPKCEGKLTKNRTTMSYGCKRHGFVRKIMSPNQSKEDTNKMKLDKLDLQLRYKNDPVVLELVRQLPDLSSNTYTDKERVHVRDKRKVNRLAIRKTLQLLIGGQISILGAKSRIEEVLDTRID